jgi:hypothetical protein
MHACDEFRERITDRIIDGIDLSSDPETQRELLMCNDCADFYSESREMLEAISAVEFEIPEMQWDAMADRMRARIYQEETGRGRLRWRRWFYVPAFAAVAALLLVTITLSKRPLPASSTSNPVAVVVPVANQIGVDPSVDPVTADYLQQSELLLRTVMKLKPNSVEDVEDARRIALHQLVALDQRKEAIAEVKPLLTVMNKYETVLRDIRNLDSRPHADDITDIKNRIEKNDLISNLTAFQPRPVAVELGNGLEK